MHRVISLVVASRLDLQKSAANFQHDGAGISWVHPYAAAFELAAVGIKQPVRKIRR
jgi:hypothetical protein